MTKRTETIELLRYTFADKTEVTEEMRKPLDEVIAAVPPFENMDILPALGGTILLHPSATLAANYVEEEVGAYHAVVMNLSFDTELIAALNAESQVDLETYARAAALHYLTGYKNALEATHGK